MHLMRHYLNSNHHVYTDRYYTNIPLIQSLVCSIGETAPNTYPVYIRQRRNVVFHVLCEDNIVVIVTLRVLHHKCIETISEKETIAFSNLLPFPSSLYSIAIVDKLSPTLEKACRRGLKISDMGRCFIVAFVYYIYMIDKYKKKIKTA